MREWLEVERALPRDADHAELIGRIWQHDVGPTLVRVRGNDVYDLSPVAVTCSDLVNLDDPVGAIRAAAPFRSIGAVSDLLVGQSSSRLLAPCDLQAIKASGVTFVASLLERVIEEQARGDAAKAEGLRTSIASIIGASLRNIRPGSAEARRVKDVLIEQGVWSQYLEVGIGPDAEIFSKGQPMSAVGTGAEIGIHPKSEWNNPEPEIVLAVNDSGRIVGATLGNDVNLRDFEGRSALLLGKAKDNNASAAIGPFIRLFDEHFTLDDVRTCDVALHIAGPDGFTFEAVSSMSQISRDPTEIVEHTIGPYHQYPDGLMLFLGTMFAPTIDRFAAGKGFTHVVGDVVAVTTPRLGSLVNRVNHCDKIAPWTFGASALMKNLAGRGLL
ncbi:MAG TPA: fumarylacetoacetate hydrolase family protein [Vicinamibacterales bacterium]|jgi:fumarylacetoacetate (FAA) hydrolase family protein